MHMADTESNKRVLLVVEDDPGLQKQLRWCFEQFEVVVAENREQAIDALRRYEPPVVLQDLGLPPDPDGVEEGLRAVQEIMQLAPLTKVIVVTGNGDTRNAVRSVGLGAYDFYQKPLELEVLQLIVERAYQMYELEAENRRLQAGQPRSPLEGVIASSPEMVKICRLIEKVAPTQASTLLLGESGTGKELLARALHDLSKRSDGPFVAINCAAIPDTLLESELFGYEKGAFTGATKTTPGKIELASGGTLFLDEIGDMPAALQAKILRFLQERVIERLGGRTEIAVDVRVVCATHGDLEARIETGDFRGDLFYRISEVIVRIPPLRERTGDAVLIAKKILQSAMKRHGRKFNGFSDEAIQAIAACKWPGNVREMENKINAGVITGEDKWLTAVDLQLEDAAHERSLNLKEVRDNAEKKAALEAIAESDGNISKAAKLLGISRPTLYVLLKKHGIQAQIESD